MSTYISKSLAFTIVSIALLSMTIAGTRFMQYYVEIKEFASPIFNPKVDDKADTKKNEQKLKSIGAGQSKEITIKIGEQNRTYYVKAPNEPKRITLLIHGRLGTDDRVAKSLNLNNLADSVIITPQGIDRRWQDARDPIAEKQDVEFLSTLLIDAQNAFALPPSQTQIIVVSNGGLKAQSMSCQRPDLTTNYTFIVANWLEINQNCNLKGQNLSFHLGKSDIIMSNAGGFVDINRNSKIISVDQMKTYLDTQMNCTNGTNCKAGNYSIQLYDSGHVGVPRKVLLR